ncbi:MAG: aminoacyl-tRNA hydrolase [Xanthomonadaceae bacterium]|nr:aminoacyl-tRNA hydrolase [Xanthomonadaceae bacterium]
MADFLVVGLGNPEKEYGDTRHNFGFLVLDKLAQGMAVTFRHRSLLEAEVGVGELDSHVVALAKPLTYMNLSGRAVAALVKFFQLREPRQLIIIHDDLDIPLGRIKIKSGGGAGGHKGVRSIIESLGTEEFLRIRLGIGLEERPLDVVDYVLAPFAEEELDVVQRTLGEASKAARMIIQEGLGPAMNFFHNRGN